MLARSSARKPSRALHTGVLSLLTSFHRRDKKPAKGLCRFRVVCGECANHDLWSQVLGARWLTDVADGEHARLTDTFRTGDGMRFSAAFSLMAVVSAAALVGGTAASASPAPRASAIARHDKVVDDTAPQTSLRQALQRHLERKPRDYLALERDLAELGATELRISVPRLGLTGGTAAEAQERAMRQGNIRSSQQPQPQQDGLGSCDPSDYFECELLLFHESSPGGTAQHDVAVKLWDFYDEINDPGRGLYAAAGAPTDVAVIVFNDKFFDEKCYDPPLTSTWADDAGGELPNVERRVRRKTGTTHFEVDDGTGGGVITDHGYVEVRLKHRRPPEWPECGGAYKELRAAGHFEHNAKGSGSWTIGVNFPIVSVSYTGKEPDEVEPAPSGELYLHGERMGGVPPTRLTYSGPTRAPYHTNFSPSARLLVSPEPGAEPSQPLANESVRFTLGSGGSAQVCSDQTDSRGVASCSLTASQRPGRTTLTVRYGGDGGYAPTSVLVPFTIDRGKTEVEHLGPKRVANGQPARLAGRLREEAGPPVADRTLRLTLGRGDDAQACSGSTDSSGIAQCTIDEVAQPLNGEATVPVGVEFEGDPYYQGSTTSATALLEFYTGRAFGLEGAFNLPLLPVSVPPQPDTGTIRNARPTATSPACTAEAEVPFITADTLCPTVTTTLAPGTSHAASRVERVTVGIPGVPKIQVSGAVARATATCAEDGQAFGSTELTLRIGGKQVPVPTKPNSAIELPGTAASLIVNEQQPVPDAEHGLTVNALRLKLGGLSDIILASATSGVHNCAG